MRIVVASALAVLGALLAVGGPMLAAQPGRAPTVYSSFVDSSCGFPVLFSFPAANRTTTTFYDRAGNVTRIQETGLLVVTLTNQVNSKSLTVNVSGPVRIDVAHGTFTATGRGTGVAPVTGVAGIVLASGKVQFTAGHFTGHATPVCPLLASAATRKARSRGRELRRRSPGPAP